MKVKMAAKWLIIFGLLVCIQLVALEPVTIAVGITTGVGILSLAAAGGKSREYQILLTLGVSGGGA